MDILGMQNIFTGIILEGRKMDYLLDIQWRGGMITSTHTNSCVW